MRALAVLENERDQEPVRKLFESLETEVDLLCFKSSLLALAAARKQEIQIAVIDTALPELGGLDLGQYLQELYPDINLIYLTHDRSLGFDALRQHASGILLKPLMEAQLQRELNDLRHPGAERVKKRVFAQTFGSFELFADGKPVVFKYSRTKEMVALLVDRRGAQTTNGEIIATLWEDDGDPEKKGSYLSNLRQDLQNTLTRLRLNGLILKQRGSMAIAVDKIECDLYDWLEHRQKSKYRYLGEYMNQYSWAESMHAELDEIAWAMEE